MVVGDLISILEGIFWEKKKFDFHGVISKQYKYFVLSGTILSDSLSFLALWRNQEQ